MLCINLFLTVETLSTLFAYATGFGGPQSKHGVVMFSEG